MDTVLGRQGVYGPSVAVVTLRWPVTASNSRLGHGGLTVRPCRVHIQGPPSLETLQSFRKPQRANHVPGLNELGTKCGLARRLTRMAVAFPKVCWAVSARGGLLAADMVPLLPEPPTRRVCAIRALQAFRFSPRAWVLPQDRAKLKVGLTPAPATSTS